MSEHTPGPWGPIKDGPDGDKREPWEPWTAFREAAPGLTIASPSNTEPIARVSGYLQPVVANARLIAAAPDLLEALEEIERACRDNLALLPEEKHGIYPYLLDVAREARDKARV